MSICPTNGYVAQVGGQSLRGRSALPNEVAPMTAAGRQSDQRPGEQGLAADGRCNGIKRRAERCGRPVLCGQAALEEGAR